jgi:hypothetical protein
MLDNARRVQAETCCGDGDECVRSAQMRAGRKLLLAVDAWPDRDAIVRFCADRNGFSPCFEVIVELRFFCARKRGKDPVMGGLVTWQAAGGIAPSVENHRPLRAF